MNNGPNQMMFPFVMPWQQQERPNQDRLPFNDIPARVKAAIEYLDHLTQKTSKRGWAGYATLNVEVTDGQVLTPSEVLAQNAANDLIADYFSGRLKLNSWEELQQELIKDTIEGEEEDNPVKGLIGKVLTCPACGSAGKIRHGCIICNGNGHLLCYPVTPQQEDGQ